MNLFVQLRVLPQKIKRLYKLSRFRKNAVLGERFSTSASGNCISACRDNVVIGNDCEINAVLSTNGGGHITIGDHTTIRGGLVGAVDSVTIGSCVIISNSVHIYDNNNHPTDPDARMEMSLSGFYGPLWDWGRSDHAPVVIEDNVWIGERVTILKGVTIGRGGVIGCDSVVTKDVPPYCIAAGNPARIVKRLKGDSEEENAV